MTDFIDKQEVINALNDLAKNEALTVYPSMFNASPYYLGAIHDAYDKIKGLPTTTEPRQKAHWINVRDGNIADCDRCNARGRAWMSFCPVCGADMRGEKRVND